MPVQIGIQTSAVVPAIQAFAQSQTSAISTVIVDICKATTLGLKALYEHYTHSVHPDGDCNIRNLTNKNT